MSAAIICLQGIIMICYPIPRFDSMLMLSNRQELSQITAGDSQMELYVQFVGLTKTSDPSTMAINVSTLLSFRLSFCLMDQWGIYLAQLGKDAMTVSCQLPPDSYRNCKGFPTAPVTGLPLYVYGDSAYPIRAHLQRPYKGAVLNPAQQDFNTSMSTVRSSVEWIFGDIVNYFKFLDFKKNLKIGLSAVGKMYVTCALMQNARNILYGSVTSEYFGVNPPTLEEYFI